MEKLATLISFIYLLTHVIGQECTHTVAVGSLSHNNNFNSIVTAGQTFILTGYIVPCSGNVVAWEFCYRISDGTVIFYPSIWRITGMNGANTAYDLVQSNIVIYDQRVRDSQISFQGCQIFNLSDTDQFTAPAGSVVGLYSNVGPLLLRTDTNSSITTHRFNGNQSSVSTSFVVNYNIAIKVHLTTLIVSTSDTTTVTPTTSIVSTSDTTTVTPTTSIVSTSDTTTVTHTTSVVSTGDTTTVTPTTPKEPAIDTTTVSSTASITSTSTAVVATSPVHISSSMASTSSASTGSTSDTTTDTHTTSILSTSDTTTVAPTTSIDDIPLSKNSGSSSDSTAAIIGGVMGGVILVLVITLILCTVMLCMRRSHRKGIFSVDDKVPCNVTKLNTNVKIDDNPAYDVTAFNTVDNLDLPVTAYPSYAAPTKANGEDEHNYVQANEFSHCSDLDGTIKMDTNPSYGVTGEAVNTDSKPHQSSLKATTEQHDYDYACDDRFLHRATAASATGDAKKGHIQAIASIGHNLYIENVHSLSTDDSTKPSNEYDDVSPPKGGDIDYETTHNTSDTLYI